MRLLSSWEQYLATSDATGLVIHQYATARLDADLPTGRIAVAMTTEYPWDGRVEVAVEATTTTPWTLSMRIPAWCRSATITEPDGVTRSLSGGPGVVEIARPWQAGDRVVLELSMPARVTPADPRVDATRGCIAFERGPMVYCIESADLPAGFDLDDVAVGSSAVPTAIDRADLAPGVIGLRIPAQVRSGVVGTTTGAPGAFEADAIPYALWANRTVGAMRVWIPIAAEPERG
jgi:DUF1680 family protein